MSKVNAAIVLLTRGYPDVRYYGRLIQRNENIYQNFNKNLEEEYPLILFHEGNIPLEHQEFIRSHNKNKYLEFVDVSDVFKWPQSIHQTDVNDLQHFTLGYRLMCKFNAYHIWDYCKQYDYIFRIDEDCFIEKLDYDVFELMQEKQYAYLRSRWSEESHELTNTTIPAYAHKIIGDKWTPDMYDQHNIWVPYCNLYVASTKFFLREDVNRYLRLITGEKLFFTNRWGDHVITGIAIKAFAKEEEVSFVPNFRYLHGSHNDITDSGRCIQGLLSPREAEIFDCVPVGSHLEVLTTYKARELVEESE